MDIRFELNGTAFVWNRDKARRNASKHGVMFEEAATAMFDPFLRIVDAARHD